MTEEDELDLMAELSQLHEAVDTGGASQQKGNPPVEEDHDDELSAAVLEELAAELDATGESGLDVDLGRSADAGRK